MNKEKCSHRAFWIVIVCLGLFLMASVTLNTGLIIGLLLKEYRGASREHAIDEFPHFVEQWSYGSGTVKAARIPVTGLITREVGDGLFTPRYDKIEMILSQIRRATHDADIRALVVEVDSPGGAITPSDEIYHALTRFKESDPERKIVVFTKDLAASGGYYLAMAGDRIVAEPTAVVGSIGVILQTLNWSELSEKIGIRDTTIKSGKNKDMLNPFQDVSPEQVSILQDLIESMHGRFVDIVKTSRGFDKKTLEDLTDGRVFSAEEALNLGLIDQLGYWDDVMETVAELLGVGSVKIIRYRKEADFFEWFSQWGTPLRWSSWIERTSPRFMYLWKP